MRPTGAAGLARFFIVGCIALAILLIIVVACSLVHGWAAKTLGVIAFVMFILVIVQMLRRATPVPPKTRVPEDLETVVGMMEKMQPIECSWRELCGEGDGLSDVFTGRLDWPPVLKLRGCDSVDFMADVDGNDIDGRAKVDLETGEFTVLFPQVLPDGARIFANYWSVNVPNDA